MTSVFPHHWRSFPRVLTLIATLVLPLVAQAARFDNSILLQGMAVRQLGGVNDIIQDGLGFIWIGGENGLARYDGTDLRIYQSSLTQSGALANNYIWDLAVDAQGKLWLATSGGLCLYHPESDQFEHIRRLYDQPLLENAVTALEIGEDGKIYAGSLAGLNVIDPTARQVLTLYPDSPVPSAAGSNFINDLDLDAEGNLWIAMALEGLARYNPHTGQFNYFVHNPENPHSLSYNRVRALHSDTRGRLLVATYGGGINVWDADTGRFDKIDYRLPGYGGAKRAVVEDLLEDSQGDIWAVVDQQGLLQFDRDFVLKRHFSHSDGDGSSLLSNQARSLFEDINGDLWVGLFPYGVSFLDRSREKVLTYRSDSNKPTSLSHSAVLSFLQDSRGTIWVGTEGGLNAFDPASGTFRRYLSEPDNPQALASNAVLSIEEDVGGDLWVGTWSGGLHRFDRESETFRRYPAAFEQVNQLADDFIWSIERDADGEIWVSSETGRLHRYRPDTDDFIRYQHDPGRPEGISNNYLMKILADRKGRIWVATYAGLNRFDKGTDTFTVFQPQPGNPHSLNSSAIKSLFEDSRGHLWVGTHDRGLNRMDPDTGHVIRIEEQHGLPAATVSSIVEDRGGDLWVATPNGVARVDHRTLKVTAFGVEHGFAGATHIRDATLLDTEGRLYFGSTEGITAFKPQDMAVSQSVHPTYVTNLRILNSEVPIGAPNSPLTRSILTTRALQFNHAHSMFSFDFVTLNFRHSRLNRYAYRLDGFDTGWNYVDEHNTATYTNLDPGRYVFRVRAKAPGEPWQEGAHAITIDIAPPPWRTWWAYAIYAALATALIYAVYAVGRLKKVSDSYRELSLTDPLTGVYNRAGIAQIVQGLFANREIKSGACIMLMDVDHFKRINDEHGHDAGDRVITDVARIARAAIRHGDYLGRWGGEEFILLCPSSTPAGAVHLAEKVRSTVELAEFEAGGGPLKVTVSLGAAVVQGGERFEQTLKRADTALYEAKARGRNRYVLAEYMEVD